MEGIWESLIPLNVFLLQHMKIQVNLEKKIICEFFQVVTDSCDNQTEYALVTLK